MWEKLSLEAVSTKPIQKLDRCLKFRNDLNFAIFYGSNKYF